MSWGVAQSRACALVQSMGKSDFWDVLRGTEWEAKCQAHHTGKLPFKSCVSISALSHIFPKTCPILSSSQNKTTKKARRKTTFLKNNNNKKVFSVPLTLGCPDMVLRCLFTLQGYLTMVLGRLSTVLECLAMVWEHMTMTRGCLAMFLASLAMVLESLATVQTVHYWLSCASWLKLGQWEKMEFETMLLLEMKTLWDHFT